MASLTIPTRPPRPVPIFTPSPSDFEGTVRQQLGDLGTGRDGFDALFAVPAGAIDADAAALVTFDEQIAVAEFAPGDFAGVFHAPVDAELPAFLDDGDALNAAVQNPGAVEGSPVVVTPPNPPTGGSGGGAGDGGTGVIAPTDIGVGDGCYIGDEFPWCKFWPPIET